MIIIAVNCAYCIAFFLINRYFKSKCGKIREISQYLDKSHSKRKKKKKGEEEAKDEDEIKK